MQRLAICLLGAPRITHNDAPVSFDTRKAVALLAYLACTRRGHSREALAALLWPEYTDARNALRRTLSSIQRVLGTGWLDIRREQVALVARSDLWVDVAHFEAHLARADDRETLAAAAALYQANFLAGFTLRDSPAFDEWQFFEAERVAVQLPWARWETPSKSQRSRARSGRLQRRVRSQPPHCGAYLALIPFASG